MRDCVSHVVSLSTFLLLACSLISGCDVEAPSLIGEKRLKLSAPPLPAPPKPCTLTVLPGTDPKKPLKTTCASAPIPAPSPALLSAQQAYLAGWKKVAPSWKGLSEKDQETKLQKLKESFMKGVTP